ncbi:hypothetical protein DL762_006856 [Monosporascus cannonballus]|uniref:Heterokaryon incompatibility domain-containing protein n=1 Tax=Monosporascus cannonballus TaxID=155416 RepID=A0ABY0H1A7_9PEZI|nr:hypothetical protein DL762_006856 [Monosporascus cannonballus]
MESWNADIVSLLYRPLEGHQPLRLLRLQAGRPGEAIACELVPTTLGDARGQYEATSYTWGSPDDPQTISCNGARMKVQRNAFSMLDGLRLPDRPRTIWIDAICINQSNLDERAAQVSMMGDIYRSALNVVVWLGPPDESSRIAMDYTATLDHQALVKEYMAVIEAPGDSLLESYFQGKTYFFDERDQTEEFKRLAFAILTFLQRPWFNRVWIQQEAALCRHTRVFCGAQSIEWEQLFSLAWIMHPRQVGDYPEYVEDALGNVFHNLSAVVEIQKFRARIFNDLYGTHRTAIYLLQTLASARRFGATDPRDKVFSLQNLATDADEWIDVDYRVPWQIIYMEVARICLENGWLDFLEAAGRARHEPGSILPSWAPDYRGGRDEEYSIREHPLWMPGGGVPGLGSPRPDSAGSVHQLPKSHKRRVALPPEIKAFKGSRKQLLQSYASVKCTMSDEIVYVSKLLDEVPGPNATYLDIIEEDLRHLSTLKHQTYLNDESITDAYKLTIILGRDAQGNVADPRFVQDNWDDWVRRIGNSAINGRRGEQKPPLFDVCFRASRVAGQFRFVITRHGYFCVINRLANVGDEIAIFTGYPLCVVLRPWRPSSGDGQTKINGHEQWTRSQANDAQYYEFIGDAYVHGMMRNEAQCIIDEFNCKYKPSESQWDKILRASDSGEGEGWKTLGFSGNYSRILSTLGLRRVKLV